MGTYTGRDIRRDIRESMQMAFDNIDLSMAYQPYNAKMDERTAQFSDEMIYYMKNSKEGENNFSNVSQTLWHSLFLQKKRLREKGITLNYTKMEHTYSKIREKGPKTRVQYRHDGNSIFCHVEKMMKIKARYERGNRKIYQEKGTYNMGYFLTWAHSDGGKYACPNCGTLAPLDTYIDGCDFCGTKFQMDVFDKKIQSFYYTKYDAFGGETTRGGGSSNDMMKCFLLPFALILIPVVDVICLPYIFYMWGKFIYLVVNNDRNGAGRNTMTKLDIQRVMPQFQVETFISAVDNKIRSIHFAKHPEQVAPFVYCDIREYLRQYEDVISCMPGKYVLKEFREDPMGNLNHIKVIMDAKLLVLKNDRKIKAKKERITMTFSRRAGLCGNFDSEVKLFRCKNCGSSISIVEGGTCQFCGTKLDLMEHDWVITEYYVNK